MVAFDPCVDPLSNQLQFVISENTLHKSILMDQHWVGLPKDGTRRMEGQDLLAFSNTVDIDNTIQYHPKLGQSMTQATRDCWSSQGQLEQRRIQVR